MSLFFLDKCQRINSYLIWLIKGRPVPPPDFVKEKIIKKYALEFSPEVFVETGTYSGDTIDALKHIFPKIFSIELDETLFKKAKERFINYSNVNLFQGDSSEILLNILPRIRGKILFWLDAHYCGIGTARGEHETPILNELKAILINHSKDNIILIDDARLFIGKHDYPKISELIRFISNYINKKNINYQIENDIIIIKL